MTLVGFEVCQNYQPQCTTTSRVPVTRTVKLETYKFSHFDSETQNSTTWYSGEGEFENQFIVEKGEGVVALCRVYCDSNTRLKARGLEQWERVTRSRAIDRRLNTGYLAGRMVQLAFVFLSGGKSRGLRRATALLPSSLLNSIPHIAYRNGEARWWGAGATRKSILLHKTSIIYLL